MGVSKRKTKEESEREWERGREGGKIWLGHKRDTEKKKQTACINTHKHPSFISQEGGITQRT